MAQMDPVVAWHVLLSCQAGLRAYGLIYKFLKVLRPCAKPRARGSKGCNYRQQSAGQINTQIGLQGSQKQEHKTQRQGSCQFEKR